MNMNRGLRLLSVIHIAKDGIMTDFFSIVHLKGGRIAQVAKVILLQYGKQVSQLGV